MSFLTILVCLWISLTNSLNSRSFKHKTVKSTSSLNEIPLELTGQLDPSKSWEVKFIHNGEEKILKVREDTSILESVEKVFDGIESSCRNGVCTTCAGRVLEGRQNVKLAVHGLGQPQIDAGFVCTCQCYPTGPGVIIKLGTYDEVYERQYGQFEKSYGELKYIDKPDVQQEKKKGFFGF